MKPDAPDTSHMPASTHGAIPEIAGVVFAGLVVIFLFALSA
jgi:hypothetical protein